MPDLKKAIKGLQIERECVSRDCDRNCGICDLVQEKEWLLSVYDDAISLLKAQEAVEPIRDAINVRRFRCGVCGAYVGFIDSYPGDTKEQDNYCRNCGRPVKWE